MNPREAFSKIAPKEPLGTFVCEQGDQIARIFTI
jgi:hypothetical protein